MIYRSPRLRSEVISAKWPRVHGVRCEMATVGLAISFVPADRRFGSDWGGRPCRLRSSPARLVTYAGEAFDATGGGFGRWAGTEAGLGSGLGRRGCVSTARACREGVRSCVYIRKGRM